VEKRKEKTTELGGDKFSSRPATPLLRRRPGEKRGNKIVKGGGGQAERVLETITNCYDSSPSSHSKEKDAQGKTVMRRTYMHERAAR